MVIWLSGRVIGRVGGGEKSRHAKKVGMPKKSACQKSRHTTFSNTRLHRLYYNYCYELLLQVLLLLLLLLLLPLMLLLLLWGVRGAVNSSLGGLGGCEFLMVGSQGC